jgi:prepilin-type N-terminal cleavage/methylation domain-containing protein
MVYRFSLLKGDYSQRGFTLVELLGVISIMTVLMGMTLGILRYASGKSSREKARAEVAAFVGAAESYKAEMGSYPRTAETDQMASDSTMDVDRYKASSLAFYRMVSGDSDANGIPDKNEQGLTPATVYMEFKSSQISKTGAAVRYIRDPWDRPSAPSSYGYATKRAGLIESGSDDPSSGRNTTFDVWSKANAPENPKAWIGNW